MYTSSTLVVEGDAAAECSRAASLVTCTEKKKQQQEQYFKMGHTLIRGFYETYREGLLRLCGVSLLVGLSLMCQRNYAGIMGTP